MELARESGVRDDEKCQASHERLCGRDPADTSLLSRERVLARNIATAGVKFEPELPPAHLSDLADSETFVNLS